MTKDLKQATLDRILSADLAWDGMCAAVQANLARYVYDEAGQCRGRCVGHDAGNHHPLCSAR